jgi:drug/metabolite transporter (DMT)-like permease
MTTTTNPALTPSPQRVPLGGPMNGGVLRGGLGWALLSSAAFGASGPMAKALLETGWSPAAVVLVRVGGAMLVLLIPCLLQLGRSGWPDRSESFRLLAYGVIAVALAQLCYFSAVQYLSVGVALLLEYLAPVLLIGWHWWRSRRRPAGTVFAGAAIAMAGMVLVLDLTSGLVLNPVGVLWGLGAALCLCGYFILAEDAGATKPIPPLLMTTAGTGVGAVVIALAGAVGFVPLHFRADSTFIAGLAVSWWVPVASLVLVSAVAAYLTGIVAVRRLGSSVASFVSLSEVIFAVVFAVVLLGQQPSLSQLAGGVLVLVGIATVQRPPRAISSVPA